MKPAEQQAQELAEMVARAIVHRPFHRPIAQVISEELNLVQLLEDKARLDWLEHNFHLMHHCVLDAEDGTDDQYDALYFADSEPSDDVRQAVTTAMKKDKPQ